ncbi:MAG: plasmid pRiA4b ORF-3 family protein, partial [Planctomycetota bacterium]
MSEITESTFPLRLTQAQRFSIAKLLAHLKPQLLLDCSNQRTLQFTLDEVKEIAGVCRPAIAKAPTGMERNSLRHVADAAERAVEMFKAGHIHRIPSGKRLYQFKITLKDIRPPIWRRIQVKDCSLDKLHEHIQTAMGWTNSHLHRFKIDDTLYGDPDLLCEGWEDESSPVNSLETKVSTIIPEDGTQIRFEYEYDFGDGWEHEILFERCLQAEKGYRYPVCVEGERACPPEDVGGTYGYEEYLEAITDPEHEEHESFMKWRGPFDPEAFDAAATTRRMRRGLHDWRR